MGEKFYSAREIIELFEKHFDFRMSEANFAKHKKSGVFRIHKVKGKKSDFYRWPDAAVDYFENVSQKTEKGQRARALYEQYMKKHREEEKLFVEIESIRESIKNLPTLSVDMFRFDPEKERREISEMLQAGMGQEDMNESYIQELEKRVGMNDDRLIQDFRCEIEKIKGNNLLLKDLSEVMTEKLSTRFPAYRGSAFEYVVLRTIQSLIMDANEVSKVIDCDLVEN